jgi:hypothetical protein
MGGSVGAVRAKRRRVGGVRAFTDGRATFYRVEAKQGRSGAFNGQH